MPKKRFPHQYTLVFFQRWNQWGELTGEMYVDKNRRLIEVKLRSGILLYPEAAQMVPLEQGYYRVEGWCE